jgi:type II secretory pathway component HofQ
MAMSQFRKSLPAFLFVLICLPVAGWTQSAEQSKDEDAPIKRIAFKDVYLRSVLATFGKQLRINIVYDEAVKDTRLSIELEDVTMKTAVKAILVQQNLQARLIEDGTIIVFHDTEANRKRYGQYKAWPIIAVAQTAEPGKEVSTQNVVFKNASLKSALAVLVKQFGIEVIFDETIKESRISIELTDVTLKAAVKTILNEHHLQARLIEEKKVIIFLDNEANRKLYEKDKVWPGEPEK